MAVVLLELYEAGFWLGLVVEWMGVNKGEPRFGFFWLRQSWL